MQDKELKKAMDTLNASLAQANVSLRTLALMKLAEDSYTKEEREDFYKRRRELQVEADELRQVLHDKAGELRQALSSDRQEPADKAAEIQQGITERHSNVREADRKVSEYEKQHPVLTALASHKAALIQKTW